MQKKADEDHGAPWPVHRWGGWVALGWGLMAEEDPERVFARRMKRERLHRGWRQEDLASALEEVGLKLHPSAIAKIEREPEPERGIGSRAIRFSEAVLISYVLGISLPDMLSDNDLMGDHAHIDELRQKMENAEDLVSSAHQYLSQATAELSNAKAAYEAAKAQAERAVIHGVGGPFKPGDHVRHPTEGVGEITAYEHQGSGVDIFKIRFESGESIIGGSALDFLEKVDPSELPESSDRSADDGES